jgi:hypothetical protein
MVPKTVYSCRYSLFIFDDVDKMPDGLLDAIKPFVDNNPTVDGVDYRRSIFIFLRYRLYVLLENNVPKIWRSVKG